MSRPSAQSNDGPYRENLRSGSPRSEPSAARTMVAVAGGDEAALSQLYDRFSPLVYSLALRITDDAADAAEVTLEVFAQAWHTARRFDKNRSSVSTWLCVLTRSRSLDCVRARVSRATRNERAQRMEPSAAPALGAKPPSTDWSAEISEKRKHITDALDRLKPDQRIAIELAYYGGLSQSQIAERLDTPLGTIKTRIRTGMARLQQLLEPLYGEMMS